MNSLKRIKNFFSILFLYAAKLILPSSKKRITGTEFKRLTTSENLE